MLHLASAVGMSFALAALAACESAPRASAEPLREAAAPSQQVLPLAPRPSPEPPPAATAHPAQAPSPAIEPLEYPSGEGDPIEPPPGAAPSGAVTTETCVKGWITPARGSPLRKAALDMIRARRSERFVVVEMRYFVGPEDAEVIGPQHDVERWYVKAYSLGKSSRRQRWLVRRADVGRGVDAFAAFDSIGYGPGTWKRPRPSDESVSDPFQRPCDRAGPGEKCMGLPREVLGCLQGT
jgi:hypothetical protein